MPLSDELVLAISAIPPAVAGTFALAHPKRFDDAKFTTQAGRNPAATRWVGLLACSFAAQSLNVSKSKDAATKKRGLKVMGGISAAVTGLHAAHIRSGDEKPDALSWSLVVAGAGLTALNLAQAYGKTKGGAAATTSSAGKY